MVSTRSPTSKASSPFNNPLVTVPKAPITIGIIVTFMFHSIFQFPSKVEVLILLYTFFQFYSVVSRDSKVDNFANSLFLLIIIRSGLLAEIRWSVCISKSHAWNYITVQIDNYHHHHHHVVLVARISLTLSRHFSLSFIASGMSSGQHPVSSHSCWMYVRAGRPCVGVHKSTSLMSSSLLLQQCPACLVRLTWIVFVIGGRWPYSWCLVGCCRQ